MRQAHEAAEMAVKSTGPESELIEEGLTRVRERLGDEQAERFVRQYYRWVPAEDLVERDHLDLYGSAVTVWRMAQQRRPGAIAMHVYNPTLEQHGWRCAHTVIDMVTDDMPFLVDSVTMELSRRGHEIKLVIHPVIRVRRDAQGRLVEVLEPGQGAPDAIAESVLHAEIACQTDPAELRALHAGLERVLDEVTRAVDDWLAMRERALSLAEELNPPEGAGPNEPGESRDFLRWLADDHFTFLGYRE